MKLAFLQWPLSFSRNAWRRMGFFEACLRKGKELSGHIHERAHWALIFSLLVGLAAWLGTNMHVLGHRIWSQEIELDYTMGVLWWGIFALGIITFAGDARHMLLTAWTGKFFVVLVAMLFYEYSYGLDASWYHLIVKNGYSPYETMALDDEDLRSQIGTNNFISFILAIGAITGPFYHALKVALAFLGLLGIWFFYLGIVAALGRPYPPAFYFLAFFPSIIFWSSILGKDPLQFFFLGLYAYGVVAWLVRGRPMSFCLIIGGLFGVYLIRPWISLIAGGAFVLATLVGRTRKWQVGVVLLAGWVLFSFAGEDQISKMFRLSQGQVEDLLSGPASITMLLDVADTTARGVAQDTGTSGGSGADLSSLMEGSTVAASLPLGMFSGLFRPLPFDITNPLTALAAAENTFVLLLAMAALFRFRLAYLRDPLVLWLALFCLMWAAAYGFIVMANFGSGVRYKLQMWPFFLMAILLLAHKEGRALLASRIPGVRRTVEHT